MAQENTGVQPTAAAIASQVSAPTAVAAPNRLLNEQQAHLAASSDAPVDTHLTADGQPSMGEPSHARAAPTPTTRFDDGEGVPLSEKVSTPASTAHGSETLDEKVAAQAAAQKEREKAELGDAAPAPGKELSKKEQKALAKAEAKKKAEMYGKDPVVVKMEDAELAYLPEHQRRVLAEQV